MVEDHVGRSYVPIACTIVEKITEVCKSALSGVLEARHFTLWEIFNLCTTVIAYTNSVPFQLTILCIYFSMGVTNSSSQ